MGRLAEDLGMMTTQIEDALERCRELLDLQAAMPVDVQRDAQHLSARVEATSIQLENTIRTMERLARRLSTSSSVQDARYPIRTLSTPLAG